MAAWVDEASGVARTSSLWYISCILRRVRGVGRRDYRTDKYTPRVRELQSAAGYVVGWNTESVGEAAWRRRPAEPDALSRMMRKERGPDKRKVANEEIFERVVSTSSSSASPTRSTDAVVCVRGRRTKSSQWRKARVARSLEQGTERKRRWTIGGEVSQECIMVQR